MARPLTARQQQVYDFIQSKLSTNGFSPTVREIGDFVGIKSPNGVMCHLRALERKGMINRTSNKSRAIEISGEPDSPPLPPPPVPVDDALAVRGYVAEGACRLFDAPQPYDVVEVLHRTGRYLLQYSGSDLRDYSIADGDMLVIEPTEASDGKSLALHQAADGSIELKPPVAESTNSARPIRSAQVIGKVVGVLRIHRQSTPIKPYHLTERQIQRA